MEVDSQYDSRWQLAEAKNRFSEVVRRALSNGPQRVTRHNEAVVVISEKEFMDLSDDKPDLLSLLLSSGKDDPVRLDDLDLRRDKSPMRDIEL